MKQWLTTLGAIIVVTVLGAGAVLQERTDSQRGFWRDWANPDLAYADRFANVTERQIYLAALKPLADVFRQTKVLNPPVGFEARPQVGIRGSIDEQRKKGPIPGQLFLQLFPYYRSCDTCPVKASGESEVFFQVVANSIDTLRGDRDVVVGDQAGDLYLEPVRTGERAGFPEFERGVLATRIARAPFLPVSRERLLRALIARAAKQDRDRAAALESELAGLSADDRAKQAWTVDADYLGPVDASDRGARRVVATNPAFFSLALPRTAIQSLVVRSSSNEDMTSAYMKGVEEAVWATLDGKRLEALVAGQ